MTSLIMAADETIVRVIVLSYQARQFPLAVPFPGV